MSSGFDTNTIIAMGLHGLIGLGAAYFIVPGLDTVQLLWIFGMMSATALIVDYIYPRLKAVSS